MWEAVFADVGGAVIAILNAMRALKVYPASKELQKTFEHIRKLQNR